MGFVILVGILWNFIVINMDFKVNHQNTSNYIKSEMSYLLDELPLETKIISNAAYYFYVFGYRNLEYLPAQNLTTQNKINRKRAAQIEYQRRKVLESRAHVVIFFPKNNIRTQQINPGEYPEFFVQMTQDSISKYFVFRR